MGWLLALTALSLVAMSVIARKESAYLYPLVPIVSLIAARGIVLALGDTSSGDSPLELPRRALGAAGLICFFLCGLVLVVWLLGVQLRGFDAHFVVNHTVAMALVGGACLLWRVARQPRTARVAVFTLLLVPMAWGASAAVRQVRWHLDEPVTPVAEALAQRPGVLRRAEPPDAGDPRPSFVSSYWHPMSAYVWERGRPWYWSADAGKSWDQQVLALEPSLRFYQIEREFRPCHGCPPDAPTHAAIVAWLRTRMVDITPALEARAGRRLSTFVFVPPAEGR